MATTIRVVPDIAPTPSFTGRQVYAIAPSPAGVEPSAVAEVPTVGATKKNSRPAVWAVVLAFAAVGVAWWIAVNAIHDPAFGTAKSELKVIEGLSIFAAFFVAALGLERLLEPLTRFLGIGPQATLGEKVDAAVEKVNMALKAWQAAADENDPTKKGEARTKATDANDQAKAALDAAAAARADAAEVKGNKAVIFWAIATVLAILAASALKLYLLRVVGIAAPPRALEILATGLIVGAGTKPLHDIVEMIQAKKDSAQGAATAQKTATPSVS